MKNHTAPRFAIVDSVGTRTLAVAFVGALTAASVIGMRAQAQDLRPIGNPRAGDPQAVVEGGAMFRTFCATCHGIGARGGTRGPDLTSGRWVHGDSDAAIFNTITKGVSGTDMPPAVLDEEEVWTIVAYLRSLGAAAAPLVPGDHAMGERLYFGDAGCARCHMIGGRGGRLGPDLSRIGAARAPAVLEESIRTPSAHLVAGFSTVRVVTRAGTTITGVLKNEDTFSLQLMDAREALHLFLKQDLKEIAYPNTSLMPAYLEARLDATKLRDVVAFLSGLRGDVGGSAPASADSGGQVPHARLMAAAREPENWLTYSGGFAGHRYSLLNQIDTRNAATLGVRWVFQSGVSGNFETTPLVVDGVMFVTGPENHVWALDARTGRSIWHYRRSLPEKLRVCCGRVNRGVAALGDRVFLATLDAHLVALDAKTGNVVWDVEVADYRLGHSFTLAPLAVKDKVVVGVAGGEFGVRGFIDAYDARSGTRIWRFYTIPGPGEPGNETWSGESWKTGGAPAWVTGAYDPDLNLTYWGIGNPGPDLYGGERQGDNLYSDSVVALDVDRGTLKWHFQYTPHDVHDWDSTQTPTLVDLEWQGRPRKLLLHANRNGFFYVLDRTTGEFLLGKAFARVTWASGIGRDGRPVVIPASNPSPDGTDVCPGISGATNFMAPSYSEQTRLLYVAAREQCDRIFSMPQKYRPGAAFVGSGGMAVPDEKSWGALRALDPLTGALRWEFRYHAAPWGGTLATAGGLVFAGDMDGYVMAIDAATGKLAWRLPVGGAVAASPMTYAVDGRQYVAVASGGALFAFGLPEAPARDRDGR
jgi:alcohol dehydrogenase (cytochrome c)